MAPDAAGPSTPTEKRKRIPPFVNAGHTPLMPDYRRNRVPGGTFFFTVNLLDRRSDLLVPQIQALRDAVRQVRLHAPFHIDAWVVRPDHMHCLWTLPAGDADFPGRWRAIKTVFSKALPARESRSPAMTSRGGRAALTEVAECATLAAIPVTAGETAITKY